MKNPFVLYIIGTLNHESLHQGEPNPLPSLTGYSGILPLRGTSNNAHAWSVKGVHVLIVGVCVCVCARARACVFACVCVCQLSTTIIALQTTTRDMSDINSKNKTAIFLKRPRSRGGAAVMTC